MGKGEKTQTRKQVLVDLESYRRLVDIQKQVVKMAKQHEQTRRECDVLREQMALEAIASLRGRRGLRYRLRISTFKFFKRLPRLTTADILRAVSKQPSSC